MLYTSMSQAAAGRPSIARFVPAAHHPPSSAHAQVQAVAPRAPQPVMSQVLHIDAPATGGYGLPVVFDPLLATFLAPQAGESQGYECDVAEMLGYAARRAGPLVTLRDLDGIQTEEEVVNAGTPGSGAVLALGQTHGGHMAMISQLQILRELMQVRPKDILVEGMVQDATSNDLKKVRKAILAAVNKGGRNQDRCAANVLLALGEHGAAKVYAAFIDPTVKLHSADLPKRTRRDALDRGGNRGLGDLTFNKREALVFRKLQQLTQKPGDKPVVVIFGYGHSFARMGPQFFGKDGFDPRFVWKNLSGFPMSEVRTSRQEALDYLDGKLSQRGRFEFTADAAHPPWKDTFLLSFLSQIQKKAA